MQELFQLPVIDPATLHQFFGGQGWVRHSLFLIGVAFFAWRSWPSLRHYIVTRIARLRPGR